MRELSKKEMKQVNGGAVFLGGVAIGLAIGAAAKLGYNKYNAYKAEKAAAAKAAAQKCASDPNCA